MSEVEAFAYLSSFNSKQVNSIPRDYRLKELWCEFHLERKLVWAATFQYSCRVLLNSNKMIPRIKLLRTSKLIEMTRPRLVIMRVEGKKKINYRWRGAPMSVAHIFGLATSRDQQRKVQRGETRSSIFNFRYPPAVRRRGSVCTIVYDALRIACTVELSQGEAPRKTRESCLESCRCSCSCRRSARDRHYIYKRNARSCPGLTDFFFLRQCIIRTVRRDKRK